MIVVKVSSKITLQRSHLGKSLEKALILLCTHKDPLYIKNKRRGWEAGMSPTMITYDLTKDQIVLWRGCLGAVIRMLKDFGVEYRVDDQRLWLPPVDFGSTVELRDYQKPLFNVMLKRQQTIIRAGAGSGKTELCLSAIAHFKQPTLIVVWQQRQQKNFLERISKYFSVEPGAVGGVAKVPNIQPITVGMSQSLYSRIDQITPLFGAVFSDEVQRAGCRTIREILNQMPAAIRIGVSDDERRKDEREFLLYDTFGSTGATLQSGTGQCDVEIVAVPTQFKKCKGKDWAGLISAITSDVDRNKQITDLAIREVKAGHRVMIWSDRVAHCQLLCAAMDRAGITAGLLIGGPEWKAEADWTEEGLNNGNVSVGIGTSVAEQSVNIPPLDRGIMTCASADGPKFLRFRQMRGRLARPYPNKQSKLFYLWDRSVPVLRRKIDLIRQAYQFTIEKGR